MRLMKLALLPACLALLVTLTAQPATAADWPMWRFDAQRSAASPEVLPAQLHLQWTRKYAPRVQVWDDPLNHDLMPYDRIFEPVVLGERVILSFNDTDKVVALDLRTGKELWAFYTDGPVRFAPVAWQDKVLFTSDDGLLYCVDAADGALKWKFRGGPSERKVLGNQRVISAWPARGGPVVRDGRVYFAASIWPFMGTFIYSLEAATGRVLWVNDSTGAQFIKQPHSAPSFAGVAPQGALAATRDVLLVPGGRSVPAAFDRQTGAFLHFQISTVGKGNGGSFVAASDTEYFVHTRQRGVRNYELKTGKTGKFTGNEPVLDGPVFYSYVTNKTGALLQAITGTNVTWEFKADASGDLIKAGRRLYAAGTNAVRAIELPSGLRGARVSWTHPLPGGTQRLLAANGMLLAVTLDGRILAFGAEKTKPVTLADKPIAPKPAAPVVAQAKAMLAAAHVTDGYALCFGAEDGALLEALVLNSKLHLVAVDPDAAKVDQLRRRFDAAGLYGKRVTLHVGDPVKFKAPPYLANLIVVGGSFAPELRNPAVLRAAFDSLRPYGGALWLPPAGEAQAEFQRLVGETKLEQAKVQTADTHLLITRAGPLPNAADWTHQYGDIGNTVKSDDARVRAPLGLLWFGGNSNLDVLPRHGHGPPEQVVGGRVILQGMDSFSARDVYTGRLLWKTEFTNLGTFGIYFDKSYTNTPLSTAYNQKHIPGANGRGANYVATEDAVYVAVGSACQVLDARTGKLRQTIALPVPPAGQALGEWAFIGLYEDVLLGGDGFANYTQKLGGGLSKTNTIEDFSASAGLAAFDRHSGKLLWRVPARHSFLHNGIVAGNGRLYALDKLPKSAEDKLKRRGVPVPTDYSITALDVRTGQPVWSATTNIFGTWLSYSKEHDVLLLAGAKATDRLKDEAGEGMTAYRGTNGSVRWQDLQRKYTGPCILHHELILTSANSYQASSGAFNLLDGKPHLVSNPLTGKLEPWRVSRAYGCNNIVASENLLTFRSGAAGFYDLLSQSGTASLGGFKSGCTANLVVANGVLNAPDFTRTCSCAYQNQTSLALVHMPEMEMWTYSQFGLDGQEGDRITRIGINFGAPGDRRAEDGTLWVEYPSVGGDSPGLPVTVTAKGTNNYYRRHASQFSGGGAGVLPWVASSGLRDCETITIAPELVRPKPAKPARTKEDDEDEGRDLLKTGALLDILEKRATNTLATSVPAKPAPPRPPPSPAPYTVRLHFAEPDDLPPGQRVFNVALQGRPVLEQFDIARQAGEQGRGLVREFKGIVIAKDLKITFTRAPGTKAGPVLAGVELLAEQPLAAK
jgi:outer membrane protein assembly factor BamB